MPTFHLTSFGCRASQADGSAIKRQLLEAGFEESSTFGHTQVAVLNTCTVTAAADAEIRRMIRRIHRENPDCRIVVAGCYAQRAPGQLAGLQGVICVVGNSDKHRIAELIEPACSPIGKSIAARAYSEQQATHCVDEDSISQQPASGAQVFVGPIAPEFHFAPVFADDRTRPTLKIQDGCNALCSFCVIPEVRGRSRSLGVEQVIAEARRLEAAGTKEIVLSGINLGSYGREFTPRVGFVELLDRILEKTAIARLRISSIEPMDVTPRLIDRVAGEPRFAQHFHIPLQSGSDRILRQMNRRYWTRQYAEKIRTVRKRMPDAAIGADVMVGFPGETEADFNATAEFIESLPFTYLHVFPYSARPGTSAAAMAEQLNGRVIHERARHLLALGSSLKRKFMAAQEGRTLSVLTLDETHDGQRVALSANYLRVLLPQSAAPANQLLDVKIGGADEGFLYAIAGAC